MSKVMVTGSEGGVGRAIIRELTQNGHEVLGFDRAVNPEDAHAVGSDILDHEALLKAASGRDVLIHLAAEPDEADFLDKLIEPNVRGLYNVCDAARQQGVPKLILASTVQLIAGHPKDAFVRLEDGARPINHYALTKLWAEGMGEMYARAYGLSVIAARLGWLPRSREHAEELRDSGWGTNVYLSHNDAARFFLKCVEVEMEPERFEIIFASSKAQKLRLDPEPAKRILRFEAEDIWPEGQPFI
tara:strand:- start:559 stop:1290 length:732 start_codon:yes stop_codon:yes gene_type:complete